MRSVKSSEKLPAGLFLVVGLILSGASCADAAEPKELKIIAQYSFINGGSHPIWLFNKDVKAGPLVIRNAEELVAASWEGQQAKDLSEAKKDRDLQKKVERQVAKEMGFDVIDWEKQMVIAYGMDVKQSSRVPPKLEFTSLKLSGETLTVESFSKGGVGYDGSGSKPCVLAVVERHNGKVEFKTPEHNK